MGIFDFFKKKNNNQENVSTLVQEMEMPEEKVVVQEVAEEVVETIPEIPSLQMEEPKELHSLAMAANFLL